jgi:dienelactone hydrolase
MKKSIQDINFRILFILIFTTTNLFGQEYRSWGKLKAGEYKVGFRTLKFYDSTRNYKLGETETFRPLLVHLWYPATGTDKTARMPYKSYLILEKKRENLNEDNPEILMGRLDVTIDEVLSASTASISNAQPAKGKFPLIIYAPSFGKSSIQNNIASEYLASHGYIVASVASAGENSATMTSDEKGILAQVLDIEYLVDQLKTYEGINFASIGSFGFSWGGLANIIHQMRNDYVKAVASWDGSIEHQGYEIVKNMKDFKPEKLKVPFVFFSNKNVDRTDFPFYKSVSFNKKYLYRLKQLEHPEFTSYWTFFSNAKVNASPYNLESYKNVCEYTLQFFDVYLKGKVSAEAKLKNVDSEFITSIKVD